MTKSAYVYNQSGKKMGAGEEKVQVIGGNLNAKWRNKELTERMMARQEVAPRSAPD